MKKKFIDKLRKNKACKMVFALSLAFTLLLMGVSPLKAFASDIPMASFNELIEDSDAYFRAVFTYVSGENNLSNVSGKQLLFVYPKAEVEYKKRAVFTEDRVVSAGNLFFNARLQKSNFDASEWIDVNTPTVYVLIEDSYNGVSEWVLGSTLSMSLATTTSGYNVQNIMCSTYFNIGKNAQFEFELLEAGGDVPIYYYDRSANTYTVLYDPVETHGNATEQQWVDFLPQTKDFIGYHYVTENGATLWKEIRFDHVVYPYWEQGADGVRKLMVYVPYEQTNYMTKDVGRYVEEGIYDYYISTVERTDEHCIQPYAWYTDYQPDTSAPGKVFEVIALPYFKDGYGAEANAERTLIEVYDSKADAISAYQADAGITPTPDPIYPIDPEPSPDPLPPTDDSESMGFVDFIKQFENLFNASGNLWKIMYYCFAYIPQQILWCMWSAVQIFLAVMIIKWIRE